MTVVPPFFLFSVLFWLTIDVLLREGLRQLLPLEKGYPVSWRGPLMDLKPGERVVVKGRGGGRTVGEGGEGWRMGCNKGRVSGGADKGRERVERGGEGG